jgi:hypothetical protein
LPEAFTHAVSDTGRTPAFTPRQNRLAVDGRDTAPAAGAARREPVAAIVPERWRFWYSLNPVVGVIDGFRWCVLGGESRLYVPGFLLSLEVVALFLWFGIGYFRRTERGFADLI